MKRLLPLSAALLGIAPTAEAAPLTSEQLYTIGKILSGYVRERCEASPTSDETFCELMEASAPFVSAATLEAAQEGW